MIPIHRGRRIKKKGIHPMRKVVSCILPIIIITFIAFFCGIFWRDRSNMVLQLSSGPAIVVGGINYSVDFVSYFEPDSFLPISAHLLHSINSWKAGPQNSKLTIFFSNSNTQRAESFVRSINMNVSSTFATIGRALPANAHEFAYVNEFLSAAILGTKADLICAVSPNSIINPSIWPDVFNLYSYFSKIGRQFMIIGKRCPITRLLPYEELTAHSAKFSETILPNEISFAQNVEYDNDFIIISAHPNEVQLSDLPKFTYGFDRYETYIPGWAKQRIPLASVASKCASFAVKRPLFKRQWMYSYMRNNTDLASRSGDYTAIHSDADVFINKTCILSRGAGCLALIRL